MFARLAASVPAVALGLALSLVAAPDRTVAQPTPTPAPAPVAPSPPAAAAPAKPAAAGEPVDLAARPALAYRGESDWDDADKALSEAVNRLYAAAAKAKLDVAGPPMIEYLDTSGADFRFTGFLPLKAPPAEPVPAPLETGSTPAGAALRFVHQGPYENLDDVYASIDAQLSAEGRTMQRVIEEYVSDPSATAPDQMVTNIYVFTE